jgi:hypothetical protein
MLTIALIRDLMFASKVTATARAGGVAVRVFRDGENLPAADRLLVDLNQAGALESAVAWKAAGDGRSICGFVSHVDGETIAKAREMGVDLVLARSAFVQRLPGLLRMNESDLPGGA